MWRHLATNQTRLLDLLLALFAETRPSAVAGLAFFLAFFLAFLPWWGSIITFEGLSEQRNNGTMEQRNSHRKYVLDQTTNSPQGKDGGVHIGS